MLIYKSYVCACPYNPYSTGFTIGDSTTDPITSGAGSSYNILFGLEPTSGECAATGVKGWHKGNCGITSVHDANYAADVLVTNLQADGHPDTGFGQGACPNFDQCADNLLHTYNSITPPTSASVYLHRDICKICKSGKPVQRPYDLQGLYTVPVNAITDTTCLITGGYYDAGQVCFDLDDGLGGETHECRCPLGTEKEFYTHENIALYDAEDGAIDGVIEFTQVRLTARFT